MIRNIILTALRNLQKNKLYATINIFGLSIAMASFIIIFLLGYSYIRNDRFNENYNSIYRIEQRITGLSNGNINDIYTPTPLSNEIQQKYPEIKSITKFLRFSNFISDKDDSKFLETGAFVDNSFLDVFTYDFIYGNANNAFSSPNSIILTDKLAKKLFDKEDVIGKVIRLDNKIDLTITAIIKEERETNFYFSYLLPFSLHTEFTGMDYNYIWKKDSSNVQTFLLLDKKHNYTELNSKIAKELNNHCEDYKNSTLYLKPLSEINFTGSNETRWKFLLLPLTLAILILVIACVNFTQLAVAYSTNRGKEVAIRKLNGSKSIHIKMQHIGEAIMLAYISLIFGFVLAEIALPIFNKGFSNDLNIEYFNNWKFTVFMIVIATLTGIFSGSYPAFYLSSQKAVNVLKNGIKTGKKGLIINKILVVSQSAFAVVLILATIYIVNQIKYINNRDVGFNQKNILISSYRTNNTTEANKIKLFKNLLIKESYISNAALSSVVPYAYGEYKTIQVEFENFNNENKVTLQLNEVGHNYFGTYGIQLKKGRLFSDSKNESNTCIINEAAAKLLGNKELLGKKVDNKFTIIGIVQDYHTYVSFEKVKPLMLTFIDDSNNKMNVISIKLKDTTYDLQKAKKSVNSIYQSIFPEDAIETKLIEDEINFYKEYLISAINLMKIFTLITIIISLIGVLGLVTYLTKRRYKEISIRKVLGASIKDVYYLIINQFFRLLVISFFISLPLSYFITTSMLQMFSDRIDITYFWFIIIPLFTIITVVLSVSLQSYNAASKNPIIALRNE